MTTLTINTSLLSNPEVLGKAGKLFTDLTLEHWVDTPDNTIENIRLWPYAKGGIETIRAKVIYNFMFPSDAIKARDILKKNMKYIDGLEDMVLERNLIELTFINPFQYCD